jgi:hypothetical protein
MYCVYYIWILTNKLDFNQETSFYYIMEQHIVDTNAGKQRS